MTIEKLIEDFKNLQGSNIDTSNFKKEDIMKILKQCPQCKCDIITDKQRDLLLNLTNNLNEYIISIQYFNARSIDHMCLRINPN